jgi:hypothetical protein
LTVYNVTEWLTGKDLENGEHSIKILYHFLHNTVLNHSEKNDRIANNLPAEHASIAEHVAFMHSFSHSFLHSFVRSFIHSFNHVSQKVSHNIHQPVLRNVRFEVLILIAMKINVLWDVMSCHL